MTVATSSITPLVAVALFWLLVYLRLRHVLSGKHRSLLPVSALAPTHPQRSPRALWKIGCYAEVDLTSPFVLRGRTMLLVNGHADLLEIFRRTVSGSTSPSRRRPATRVKCCAWDWGSHVRTFYNFGSVLAILGQTLAIGVLWWSLLQFAFRLLGNPDPQPSDIMTHNLVKRNTMLEMQVSNHPTNELLLRPLIPGINLPLSHLVPIFISLMVCTTIHELGHAIAAAADGVSLVSWGYYLIFVIPAAFVELAMSSSSSWERPPLHRLRTASAGAYHNLITILVLFFISRMSVDRIIWPFLGYQHIESGVVVVDVQASSPLQAHLTPGTIVTRIDDSGLSKISRHSPQDVWASRLLTSAVELDEGWCVERRWFNDHPQNCCPSSSPPHTKHGIGSCFINRSSGLTSSEHGRCIDPVMLFEDQTRQRCVSHADCNTFLDQSTINATVVGTSIAEKGQTQMCVKPHLSEGLLRISFLRKVDDIKENVIVWKGPRWEVWEQVTVGEYLPRLRILSISFPKVIGLLVEYLRTVSLCLFFLNLLPIRLLDGGEILNAFLELVLTSNYRESIDLEMGRREGANQSYAWRHQAQRIVSWAEMMGVALVGLVTAGGLLELGVR